MKKGKLKEYKKFSNKIKSVKRNLDEETKELKRMSNYLDKIFKEYDNKSI